jgi:hypothetical protein
MKIHCTKFNFSLTTYMCKFNLILPLQSGRLLSNMGLSR